MKEGINNDHEHWFSRCASLGWTRARGDDGSESVTSMRGVTITWDPGKKVFRWDRAHDRDFRRLVNLVIVKLDASVHDNRVRIASIRQTTRELIQVLEEDGEPSYLDNWVAEGNRMSLAFYVGPLEISATTMPTDKGVAWAASLSNGRSRYDGNGVEPDFDTAKTTVYENLLKWSDEFIDTGRHAIKLYTRLQTKTE